MNAMPRLMPTRIDRRSDADMGTPKHRTALGHALATSVLPALVLAMFACGSAAALSLEAIELADVARASDLIVIAMITKGELTADGVAYTCAQPEVVRARKDIAGEVAGGVEFRTGRGHTPLAIGGRYLMFLKRTNRGWDGEFIDA